MGLMHDGKRYRALCENFGIFDGHVSDVLRAYSSALCELTGGRLSKVTYCKDVVVEAVQKHFCEGCDKNIPVTPKITVEGGRRKVRCGVCNRGLRSNDNYCPFCGTKVGSDDET